MAEKLRLIYYGNPVLNQRCSPIKEITPEIRELVEGMLECMDRHPAAGLAANQVGKLLRVFVFCTYENVNYKKGTYDLSPPNICINPRIIELSTTTERAIDNCLSVPGVDVYCTRPDRVVFEAMDLEGKMYRRELTGYNARVFLHENDHINGILNVDRLARESKEEYRAILPKLKKLKKKHSR